MGFILGAIKIIFVLGFLVFIHEGGHFLVARACKVKVKEFSIGFGPIIFSKKGEFTKYSLRLIPFGGFVDMVGEAERKDEEGSFSNASVWKRILIVAAGAIVNIVFALILFFILMLIIKYNFGEALNQTGEFLISVFESLIELFKGNVSINDMAGPIGISEIIVKTDTIYNFIYLISLISISLGVTNLLPIPALDGGRIILLLIEAIRKKPLKEEIETNIQMIGFLLIITLAVIISFNDIIRIF